MKIEGFFVCHLLKPFFSTKTFVDTANEQQNRYYFPILCISIQALVDLTNIPRFSLWHWAGYFIWLRKSSLKNYVFKALLLLRTMLNRWCGFSACCAYWWQKKKKKKKKKQFFLVSHQVLSLKKRTDSILQRVFLRSSTWCFRLYSRRLTTTTQGGDPILSFFESCLLSNPVGKTTKTSSSKQVILQMHSICFSSKDMTSVKIWRDEIKAAENLLFTGSRQRRLHVLKLHRTSDTQSHTDARDNLEISCEYSVCSSEPAL